MSRFTLDTTRKLRAQLQAPRQRFEAITSWIQVSLL
jgi:hypothetical protein